MAESGLARWFSADVYERLLSSVRSSRPRLSRADIEDALHDVLERIYRKVATDAPPAEPSSWEGYMFRAVTNRLNDMHRSGRRLVSDDDQLAVLEDENAEVPDAALESVERAALFQMFVSTLKGDKVEQADTPMLTVFAEIQAELRERLIDKQWILLRLRGLQGLGFAECARALGASLGSVHAWYNDALKICESALARRGLALGDGT